MPTSPSTSWRRPRWFGQPGLLNGFFDDGAEAPELIIVDRLFTNSASDMEALDELARHAASLPALLLTGVGASFFGIKFAWQMSTLPAVSNVLDQWQFAKWKTLRQEPFARFLGVVFGRCLLRSPYERGGGDDLGFQYRETCVTDRDFVWASGAIVAAVTVGRSVAETHWPTGVSGPVNGRVEGFKIGIGGKDGKKKFGPSDPPLTQEKIEELGMAGVNAIGSAGDHDDVLFCNGMSAARVTRDDINALLEVSLPYQLFATRLSVLLFALKPHLLRMDEAKLIAFVTQHVRDWLPFEDEPGPQELSVQVRPADDDPSRRDLAVTVTPPAAILPHGVPVVMGYRLA